MIRDTEGNRLSVIGWADSDGDARVGIHRLGVGAVLTFDVEQATTLVADLNWWIGLVQRAATELAEETTELADGFTGPLEFRRRHDGTEHVVFTTDPDERS